MNAEIQKPTRANRAISAFGIVLTLTYLTFVATYWFGNAGNLGNLPPNELGDFLAGVFAPLAFLWLVLGFFQQGIELRNSAEALWLQGRELQNSVEQQRELVRVTREQLAFEGEMLLKQQNELARNSQPILKLVGGGSVGAGQGKRLYQFQLFNHGKSCTDLRIFRNQQPWLVRPSLNTGESLGVKAEFDIDEDTEFSVEVHYLDARLMEGKASFTVVKEGQVFTVSNCETLAT